MICILYSVCSLYEEKYYMYVEIMLFIFWFPENGYWMHVDNVKVKQQLMGDSSF